MVSTLRQESNKATYKLPVAVPDLDGPVLGGGGDPAPVAAVDARGRHGLPTLLGSDLDTDQMVLTVTVHVPDTHGAAGEMQVNVLLSGM